MLDDAVNPHDIVLSSSSSSSSDNGDDPDFV